MIEQLILLNLIIICSCFSKFQNCRIIKEYKQFYLKDKFSPVLEEKTIKVKHNKKLFNHIEKGVFYQIGSNPKHVNDEDYHWFDGDGMVHSIFFNENEVVYHNKWVQTKRLQTEDKWNKKMYLYFGELKGVKGLLQILKYSLLEMFGLVSKSKGTANTAMLNWNNRIFALHEGDMPYELNVDHDNYNISTINRIHFPSIYSMTAHPVVDKKRNLLYMYGYNNYDFSNGQFIFNVFDKQFEMLSQKNISLINNGMVHDVGYCGDYMIIPDMPLKYDSSLILKEKLPMFFDKENGQTRFGIFDVKKQDEPKWVYFDENFFIFHFSRAYRRGNKFYVFACVMDELYMEDFVELKNIENKEHLLRGNIRLKEIQIDLDKNTTKIVENQYLQHLDIGFKYNMDFPILSKKNKKEMYCTIFDASTGYIRGYVKSTSSWFKYMKPKVFIFPDYMYANSEPQLVIIENKEYLISFVNKGDQSYCALINIDDKTIEKIEIPTRIPPGFHSMYLDSN